MNFIADFQLQVQDFPEVQGRYVLRRILLGVPLDDHVSKDVIVIEYEHDRVPSKPEKIELEKSKRVISGFEVNREWTAKELEKRVGSVVERHSDGRIRL